MIRRTILGLCFMATSLVALEPDNIKISGIFTGGYNDFHQKNRTEQLNQFDYAANLNFDYQLNPNLSGYVEFQTGIGDSTFGFSDVNVGLNDIVLEYTLSDKPLVITMGSFGAPFGQFTDFLSNNADISGTALIMDPLGGVGAFNSVGVMTAYTHQSGSYTATLSNGTGSTAANTDGELSGAVRYISPLLAGKFTIGGAYQHSSESVDYDAWIVDMHANFDKLGFKTYVSQLHYVDGGTDTNDRVMTSMIEVSYQVSNPLEIAIRGSFWDPEDRTGDRTTGLSNPASATNADSTLVVDQRVTRYQLGGTYQIDAQLSLKGEMFYDDYTLSNSDVPGALLYMTAGF